MDIQQIKQRFGIIGNDPMLNRALEKTTRVAPTDISVLITGESGVGKESIPKIIHSLSHRKHAKLIAVNCGAIPEGTIDSELFGHEKGSFTGATTTRKGYFEVADGGTIFLDEVGELPLTTQVRLLRVLENGEFLKVGSSNVQKTNIRVVAATNLNMKKAIANGKFREDLFYRLSTIEIEIPPLRSRKEDIHLLFRKFAADFAQKYQMPSIRLTENAIQLLNRYAFPGNIRQLRNIAEQISVIEQERLIDNNTLKEYLPYYDSQLPSIVHGKNAEFDYKAEREMMYNVILEMRKEIDEIKQATINLIKGEKISTTTVSDSFQTNYPNKKDTYLAPPEQTNEDTNLYVDVIEEEEDLSLEDQEILLIKKALERHNNKRKLVAKSLGISERTLYRKINQYDL